MIPGISVHRAADRSRTDAAGVASAHSFSFGSFHDPANTQHGLLIAHNEDVLEPGAGFDPHPHRDMEIVTWVLSGALAHSDSTGHSGVLLPGSVQRLSAGTGVTHSERNAAETPGAAPVHYLQMWIVPDVHGTEPSYAQAEVELVRGELVPVASGRPAHRAAISLRNRAAELSVAQLEVGDVVFLPEAPYLHLFVAGGQVVIDGAEILGSADAARFTDGGRQQVIALAPAQILVWAMDGTAFS